MTGAGKGARQGALGLADGTILWGSAWGELKSPDAPQIGEVVFNTSMYGYQEILTDPSYAGQIMTFTYPHIGNVGCNKEDVESSKVWVEGVVVRELSRTVSNFRAEVALDEYLTRSKKMGLSGIDTRALVVRLRDGGAQMGAMADVSTEAEAAKLVEAAKSAGSMLGKNLVYDVATTKSYSWNSGIWKLGKGYGKDFSEEALATRPHCVAIDCGIKQNILRLLVDAGFRVTVVSPRISAPELAALKPDGLFLSNGPGDPATLCEIVTTVRSFVGQVPMFGICLGHQILGQVFGGTTYKLKFGHRGGNHPVKELATGKVDITVQNHGFAVEGDSLPSRVEVTHVNLNDHTVEGLESKGDRAFSIQYHPESSPGPHDSLHHFKKFYQSVVGYA